MTARCLEALREQVESVEIVSNGSDGTVETYFGDSGVPLVTNEANEAFSTCINGAAERARSEGFDALMFVTNDVTVLPGVVETLRDVLIEHEDWAGVSPMQLRDEDPIRLQHAGGEFKRGKCKAIVMGGDEPRADWPSEGLHERDWIDGASSLWRLEAWDSVGKWRPEYGFYWEDVDWGIRAVASGWKVGVEASAEVRHMSSGTASRYGRWQDYMLARNRALCAYLNFPEAEFARVYGYLKTSAVARLIQRPFGVRERVFWAAIRDAVKGGLIDPTCPVTDDDPIWKTVLGRR